VAFGTIAESADGVRALLARYHDDIESRLTLVEGKRQMNLVIGYGGNIYEHLVTSDPELRQARDELREAGDSATREQKIDVGQRFEAALDALREQLGRDIEDLVRAACSDFKRLPPRSEHEMARFACLVDQRQEAAWDELVTAASAKLPDVFTISPAGPFPPYDFVDLHLQA
jgi:hypothetical protein